MFGYKKIERYVDSRIKQMQDVVLVGYLYCSVHYDFGETLVGPNGKRETWKRIYKLELEDEHGDFVKIRGTWFNKKYFVSLEGLMSDEMKKREKLLKTPPTYGVENESR